MAQSISRRMRIIVILGIILIIVLAVILMQVNTNSIMKEIEDAFYCTDYYIEESIYNENPQAYLNTEGRDYVPYDSNIPNLNAHFNFTGHFSSNESEVTTELKLQRVFAWHNFSKGILWIKYSVEIYNEQGERISGSWDVPVKLSIQKKDGEWIITHIDEAP